jgi:hypothetical protein
VKTLKIFVGGTPQETREAYKAWWDHQRDVEVVEQPVIEPAGKGFKLTVWYRQVGA